jgi:DNA invertase Pin-like site-specific DNA recombinase
MTQARIYLRASTKEQNEERALAALLSFAQQQGYGLDPTTDVYADAGISGLKPLAERPKLKTLLKNSKAGDVLLVEQIDRLSRMEESDWLELKRTIEKLGLVVVVVGLPMTHNTAKSRFDRSLQSFMLDIAAEQAHADLVVRKERLAQGRANSTKPNIGRHKEHSDKKDKVLALAKQGLTITQIHEQTKFSRVTITKYLKAD